MAQSVKKRMQRGHLRMVWNKTFNVMDFYRRASNGRFILCNPWANRDIAQGPGHHSKTLDKWEKEAA